MPHPSATPAQPAAPLRRWLPVLIIGLLLIAGVAAGALHLFDIDDLARRYGVIAAWIAENPALAVVSAIGLYTLATALSLPAGWVMTLFSGLFFGWALGGAIALFSATTGATLLFLLARSALAPLFLRLATPWVARFAEGFRRDAASYLLFLRLAPVIPFSVVNILPALFGVRLSTFVWTTLVGILPGAAAYVTAGSGLRAFVTERAEACAAQRPPCGTAVGPGDFINPQILVGLLLLAIVALVPVLWKRLRPARGERPLS